MVLVVGAALPCSYIDHPRQDPKGEHACNGRVEEAGRTIMDMLRVFKLQLEARLKQDVEMEMILLLTHVNWQPLEKSWNS